MAEEAVVEDVYASYIKEKREKDAKAPEIQVTPTFTEEEAVIVAALIDNVKDQLKTNSRSTLVSALAKLDRAIGRARDEVRVVP